MTEYHYRVVATNSNGTTYGQDVSFKNSRRGTIEATTEIGSSYATFNATIDPEGQKTYYQFEYSPDTSYSLKAPEPHAVAGSPRGSHRDTGVAGPLAERQARRTRSLQSGQVASLRS